jgi:hypothetical protein
MAGAELPSPLAQAGGVRAPEVAAGGGLEPESQQPAAALWLRAMGPERPPSAAQQAPMVVAAMAPALVWVVAVLSVERQAAPAPFWAPARLAALVWVPAEPVAALVLALPEAAALVSLPEAAALVSLPAAAALVLALTEAAALPEPTAVLVRALSEPATALVLAPLLEATAVLVWALPEPAAAAVQ